MKILLTVHALPPQEFSGTPLIAQAFAGGLAARGHLAAVVAAAEDVRAGGFRRSDDASGWVRYDAPITERRWKDWSLHDVFDCAQRGQTISDAFAEIFDDFSPDILHVIDLVNLPSIWPCLAKRRGAAVVRSVYNMEDLCARISPIRPGRAEPCAAPITVDRCTDCSLDRAAPAWPARLFRRGRSEAIARALTAKRRYSRHLYNDIFDAVFFTTRSSMDFFLSSLPIPERKVHLIESGTALPAEKASRPATPRQKLVFAYLGSLIHRKGVGLLARAFLSGELLARGDYELRIHGAGDARVIDALLRRNPNASYRGPYEPSELSRLLEDVDIGLSPSVFEVSHGVTREYLTHGVAVIGSTAFGIPEAVVHGVNGLLFKVGDLDAFKGSVLYCLDHRLEVERMRRQAAQTQLKRPETELSEIEAVYRAVRP